MKSKNLSLSKWGPDVYVLIHLKDQESADLDVTEFILPTEIRKVNCQVNISTRQIKNQH